MIGNLSSAFGLICMLSPALNADLLIYEGWDYDVQAITASGTSSLDGGGGFDGAWSFSNPAGNTQIISPGASYPGVTTTGNLLQLRNAASRDLSNTYGGPTESDLWLSFFFRTNNTQRHIEPRGFDDRQHHHRRE